jgi:hypothetical protein
MPDEPPVVINVPPAEAEAPMVEPAAPIEPALLEEEELDLVAQMIAEESIINEERADELMEGVEECQSRLEELSTLKTTLEAMAAPRADEGENPMLTQIQRQLAEVQTQLAELRASMVSPTSIRTPSANGPNVSDTTQIEEPPVPPSPAKRRRFARL